MTENNYEGPETKKVIGVQFSIMSPQEIRKRSVVEVTKHETFDKDVPYIKGLFDIRMGTTDMGKICGTCGQNNKYCPGHFGHVELARPVYNFHFITQIQKILKCVCFRCSKLLINKEDIKIKALLKKPNKLRWAELYMISQKIQRCGQENMDGCGCLQPSYKLEGMDGIKATWKKVSDTDISQSLKVEQVKDIFEKITDEDCRLLGYSELWCRPEWLICSVFPVPPPSVRPSVKQDDSQRMEDDLTHKLCDIIKCNNTLRHKINTDSSNDIINDWTKVLQYHCATLIDNELPGVAQSCHRSGRPFKAIRQRLKGKDGRIRNNLMGKRVDFSARSVITPDPNIELDELGVPIIIAKNLTYPEIVNDFNKEKLTEYLNNGNDKYPGIKSILKDDITISINVNNKKDIILENGDIVNRHLLNGDYVLFNRQPSLHKMSMMGHRVKVMKGHTFRLNISVTPPYNADFDGDEMNMHAPQSIAARMELMNIASVNYQIISPRENKPIITIVQDTLLGINKLTKGETIKYISNDADGLHYSNNTNIYVIPKGDSKEVSTMVGETAYFTKPQMMNVLCECTTFDGSYPEASVTIKDVPFWSGKDILSYIIPDNINLKMENSTYDNVPNELLNKVKIVNGNLITGGLDKGVFTKVSKGLIHTINNDLGPLRAKDFINDLQRIATSFLLIEGFSIGIGDMVADSETNSKIRDLIEKRKKDIEGIQQEIHLNIFENNSGNTNSEYFESKVNALLNKTLNETGKMGLASLDEKNRATNMVNCGSKGNTTNIAQIVACLGQQNVDGKRIPYGYNNRTLPHYYKFDDSAEARGFVENSFISGQTPQEFFFHAMGGREGLIDTAVKTSETGYIQRKIMKLMEDLKVNYDYSVRNSEGNIIQFIYGDDGMDATFVESQPLEIIKMSTENIIKNYLFEKTTDWSKIVKKEFISELQSVVGINKLNDSFNKILEHKDYLLEEIFKLKDIETSIYYPVHIKRITENTCKRLNDNSNISPLEILKQNEILKNKLQITGNFKNNIIIHILIDIHLHPKTLMKYNIQSMEYNIIITEIQRTFETSKISPGEMVGALAAQSIGEPATQMTLNTFHYAGVSAKSNVTRGIPRLRELLHVSQNLKSPSTKIFIKDEYNNINQGKAEFIKNKLEYTILKDVLMSSEIYYDPLNNKLDTDIDGDKEILSIYKEFMYDGDEEVDYSQTPWIIRFIFNKEIMMEKGIIMEDIFVALMKYDNEKINFIFSDDNSKELVGRVSIKPYIEGTEDDKFNGLLDQTSVIDSFKNIEHALINNVVIKGIKGITNIVMDQEVKNIKKNFEYNFDLIKEYEKNLNDKSKDKKELDKLLEEIKIWVLETDGVNILEVLNYKYIDTYNTISNDIHEMNKVFGIEAVRQLLIDQMVDLFDSYINIRHISLLADIMTNKGVLTPITRQGINVGDTGPLGKCSFEDTTDQLIKASVFGEIDHLQGVSSNIMLGQLINAGTGMCGILLDEEKLIAEASNMDITEDDFIEVTENNIDTLLDHDDLDEEDDGCENDDFKFSFE
jgi:DNA-directed RNA polymerase II subunit RPB1